MADAEKYARWIVANSGKKGTPEFETVAAAYKAAKSPQEPSAMEAYTGQLARTGGAALKGLLTGGPAGAMASAATSGMEQLDEIAGKAAYEGGGYATDVATKMGASPETAAKLGVAANVGIHAIPSIATMRLGRAAAPTIETGARKLMSSALKPTLKDLERGKAARAITTMLDEGINPTPSGVRQLQTQVNDLRNEVKTLIDSSTASVNKYEAWDAVKGALDKFTAQANPNASRETIRAAWREFLHHPLIKGDTMPVQIAQAIKQGTYKFLDNAYGELGAAGEEAQKAIARGLKEGIGRAVPKVAPLNARESELINALKVAQRRALMDANKNPLGLGPLASSPTGFFGFLADRSAGLKGLLARGLYSGREVIPQGILGLGAASYMGQRAEDYRKELP